VLDNELYLVNQYNPQTCGYSLHQRQGNIVGLRNRGNGKWMGQSFLGSLQCASKSFGRREEFEVDSSPSDPTSNSGSINTRLLCASAGWGHGAYLQVHESNFAVSIGGSSVEDARHAARWCLVNQQQNVDVSRSPQRS